MATVQESVNVDELVSYIQSAETLIKTLSRMPHIQKVDAVIHGLISARLNALCRLTLAAERDADNAFLGASSAGNLLGDDVRYNDWLESIEKLVKDIYSSGHTTALELHELAKKIDAAGCTIESRLSIVADRLVDEILAPEKRA